MSALSIPDSLSHWKRKVFHEFPSRFAIYCRVHREKSVNKLSRTTREMQRDEIVGGWSRWREDPRACHAQSKRDFLTSSFDKFLKFTFSYQHSEASINIRKFLSCAPRHPRQQSTLLCCLPGLPTPSTAPSNAAIYEWKLSENSLTGNARPDGTWLAPATARWASSALPHVYKLSVGINISLQCVNGSRKGKVASLAAAGKVEF